MRRQFFSAEEFRQPVIFLTKSSLFVKGLLCFENVFAKVDDIITGEINAETGIDKVDQCRKTAWKAPKEFDKRNEAN